MPAANEVPAVETPEGATEEAEAIETAETTSDADPDRPDADKQSDKNES